MADITENAALETIDLLGPRLERLELLLGKQRDEELDEAGVVKTENTVAARISSLEQNLQLLLRRSTAARDLLELHAKHPSLFDGSDAKSPQLTPEGALAIILSSGPLYHSTASRLNSINDVLPVPSAESLASLITLQPRVSRIQLLQTSQAQQMAELRQRTTAVLERWYEIGILSNGDCCNEWENRLSQAELAIRRRERSKSP